MNHVDVSSPPMLSSTILSSGELITLAAAADRIIPSDSESPGGAEGGSLAYIVRHLEDGGNLVPFRDSYHAFLGALAAEAFVSRSATEQDAVLSRMETNPATAAERFFRLFAEHAQEGYYTNPINWPGIGFIVTG